MTQTPIITPRNLNAPLILILGILGVTVLHIVAPAAWYLGRTTLREMDQGLIETADRPIVKAGTVLGIVGTTIIVVALILIAIAFVVMGAAFLPLIHQMLQQTTPPVSAPMPPTPPMPAMPPHGGAGV